MEPLPDRATQSSAAPEQTAPIELSALREAREERGISLERAAADSRIAAVYLRALEEGSPLEEFPGPAYARFFVRDYARYLGIPEHAALRAFESVYGDAVEPPRGLPQSTIERQPRRLWARALVLASVAALVALGITSSLGHRPRTPSAPNGARPATSPRAASPSPSPSPSPRAVGGIEAALAVKARCWVDATGDGAVLISETLSPGRTVTLRAKKTLHVVLGNGGGVVLRVNGKIVATGRPGQVVQLTFTWRGGRVVTG
jgi:cytoskeleton protein RodZ